MHKKNAIKFAHQYLKLYGQIKGRLLHVEMLSSSKLSSDFIELDTAYTTDGADRHYYPLPGGLAIILVFIGNKQIPFTTVRKGSDKNLKKYESLIGEWFEILVEEENEHNQHIGIDFEQAAKEAEAIGI